MPDKRKPRTDEAGRGFQKGIRKGLLASRHIKDLASAVVTAGRAGDVAGDGGSALRASLEDGCTPACGALAHALTALGLSAFWVGHVGSGSASVQMIQGVPDALLRGIGVFCDDRVHGFEPSFGGTISRLNVSIFTARVAWKGEENIFPDLIRQVDRFIIENGGGKSPVGQVHGQLEAFEATAALQAELGVELSGDQDRFSIGFELEIEAERGVFGNIGALGQTEKAKIGLAMEACTSCGDLAESNSEWGSGGH